MGGCSTTQTLQPHVRCTSACSRRGSRGSGAVRIVSVSGHQTIVIRAVGASAGKRRHCGGGGRARPTKSCALSPIDCTHLPPALRRHQHRLHRLHGGKAGVVLSAIIPARGVTTGQAKKDKSRCVSIAHPIQTSRLQTRKNDPTSVPPLKRQLGTHHQPQRYPHIRRHTRPVRAAVDASCPPT